MAFDLSFISINREPKLDTVHRGTMSELIPILLKCSNRRSGQWCATLASNSGPDLRITMVRVGLMIISDREPDLPLRAKIEKYSREHRLVIQEVPIQRGQCFSCPNERQTLADIVGNLAIELFNPGDDDELILYLVKYRNQGQFLKW